ncbi:hypothetical protein E4U26_004233 [Claviceps purpurea]|nr:hypothetical protein E4U26_004233 [Claviceps purpurea]
MEPMEAQDEDGPVVWLEVRGDNCPYHAFDALANDLDGDKFKKLSSRMTISKRRPKKNVSSSFGAGSAKAAPPLSTLSDSSSTHNTDLLRKHRSSAKLFGLSVLVYAGYKGKQVFDLVPGQAVADQGAEISIISRSFVLENKIPVYDLGTVGFRGLQMINADGRHNKVSHFVSIQVVCEGVKRMVWAVVTPDLQPDNRTVLILGLHWLHDVCAKFDIRRSELTLGDADRGDVVETVRGPQVTLSDRQKILLCPSEPSILEKYVGWDDADHSPGSSSSSSSESDDESDSELSGN